MIWMSWCMYVQMCLISSDYDASMYVCMYVCMFAGVSFSDKCYKHLCTYISMYL